MRQKSLRKQLPLVLAISLHLGSFLVPPGDVRADDAFLRGDVNTDGATSLSDSLMLWDWLFRGEHRPLCMDAADLDDHGVINIHDQIRILSFLFSSDCRPGPQLMECLEPAAPYPAPGVDPTRNDDLSCDVYEVIPPVETNDLVRFGDAVAAPGQTVEIPVFVTNSRDAFGFQLVVRYDPDVFTPHSSGLVGAADSVVSLEGTYYRDVDEKDWPEVALGSNADEEYFVIGFIPGIIGDDYALPPGEEILAFKIRGKISDSAKPGTRSIIEPTNGTADTGLGAAKLRNEITYKPEAGFVSVRPRIAGTFVRIVSDQTFFRGDSNRDQSINTSDAVHTLIYLFTEVGRLTCEDAADSNDDGSINLSDATFLLSFLFQRGASPPPPHRELGIDPTPDSLDCARGISG